LRQTLTTEFNRLDSRYKLVIPFVFLLLIKFLFDHLTQFLLIFSIIYSTSKIRNITESQISLKSRSKIRTLLFLFFFNAFVIMSLIFFIELLGYNENLFQQLSLHILSSSSRSPSASTSTSTVSSFLSSFSYTQDDTLLQVIYNIMIADIVVQTFTYQVKIAICCIASVRVQYFLTAGRKLFNCGKFFLFNLLCTF
jgi:hypothetical protein